MDRSTMVARLRQLQAIDLNAQAIYAELSEAAEDAGQRQALARIAADEKRHVALGKELLSILEK